MDWGPQGAHPSGYAAELAAFIRERSGGGPAVLWPEHDPQIDGAASPGQDFGSRLARRLAVLAGQDVTELPVAGQGEADVPVALAAEEGDLLLVQGAGSSTVQITVAGGPNGVQRPVLRLLDGQVLFLPDGALAVLHREAGTRHVLLRIAPPSHGPGTVR